MPGASEGGRCGEFALDALGAAGGARRELKQVAFDLVVDRCIRFIGNAFGVAVPAVQIVVGDDQQLGQPVGQLGVQTLERLAKCRRADDGLRAAVVDDVGSLGRSQMGVDRDVVQAAAPRRPHHGVVVLVVLHQDRDRVALAQAVLAEEVREPVGAGLQLAECHRRARRMHDDGGLIGVRLRMLANLHG